MTLTVRRNQLTLVGMFAGVAIIPTGILMLLFLAEKILR